MQVIRVSRPNVHAIRVTNDSPGRVTSTTHVGIRDNTRVVSVGVNYPTGGIGHGLTNSTLLRCPSIIGSVLARIIGTISIPIALGVHAN